MVKDLIDSIGLYVSDAATLLLFAGGLAWLIERILARRFGRFFVEIPARQISRFLYAQLAIVLIALCGFKWVVLTGGPGIDVKQILSTGKFTQIFSAIASGLAFVLVIIGVWRWLSAFKQWFRVKWYS